MSDSEARGWRKYARDILGAKNIMTLSPMDNDYRGLEGRFLERLVEKDKAWIMSSKTILANCPAPSFGTAMEIQYAWTLHKQIVAISEHTSPWLRYHATVVVPTLDDALELLEF